VCAATPGDLQQCDLEACTEVALNKSRLFLTASQEWFFLSSTPSVYLKPHLKTGLCTFLFTVKTTRSTLACSYLLFFGAKWITSAYSMFVCYSRTSDLRSTWLGTLPTFRQSKAEWHKSDSSSVVA